MLCLSLVEIGPVSGSGEEDENVKSLQTDGQTDRRTDRQTDRQTDGQTDRRRTTGDQKSSLELSARVSFKEITIEVVVSNSRNVCISNTSIGVHIFL